MKCGYSDTCSYLASTRVICEEDGLDMPVCAKHLEGVVASLERQQMHYTTQAIPPVPLPDLIKRGDTVEVMFVSGGTARAVIVWTPYNNDDHCWYLRGGDPEELWTLNPYASDFGGMRLLVTAAGVKVGKE